MHTAMNKHFSLLVDSATYCESVNLSSNASTASGFSLTVLALKDTS